MTTVLDKKLGNTPAVHAFVIGVGEYPFLKGGEQAGPKTWNLGQLSSAPLSALEFANWLAGDLALPAAGQQPELPLGSIELLVSQHGMKNVSFDPPGATTATKVDRAGMANLKQAFKRWLKRCDENEANIALFFFSGHGVATGGWQGLMLEGFDPNSKSLFEEVIDFDQFALGMDQCLARRQCFLVDACRNTPPELLEKVGDFRGDPLLAVDYDSASDEPRDACIIRATAAHQTAYGIDGQPTRFTSALMRALRGAGCSQLENRWEVRTDSIVPNLNALLKYDARVKLLPIQEVKGPGDDSSGFVLHVPKQPKIPIVVGCLAPTDTAEASLCIELDANEVGKRAPAPEDWETEIEIAVEKEYEISARFANGIERKKTIRAQPPIREVRL
jgi:hypothetical protein